MITVNMHDVSGIKIGKVSRHEIEDSIVKEDRIFYIRHIIIQSDDGDIKLTLFGDTPDNLKLKHGEK